MPPRTAFMGELERVINSWHDRMSDACEMDYIRSLRSLEADSPYDRWALNAGCAICSRFWTAYSHVLWDRFGIVLSFPCAVISEIDPGKRQFLSLQHTVQMVVSHNAYHVV